MANDLARRARGGKISRSSYLAEFRGTRPAVTRGSAQILGMRMQAHKRRNLGQAQAYYAVRELSEWLRLRTTVVEESNRMLSITLGNCDLITDQVGTDHAPGNGGRKIKESRILHHLLY